LRAQGTGLLRVQMPGTGPGSGGQVAPSQLQFVSTATVGGGGSNGGGGNGNAASGGGTYSPAPGRFIPSSIPHRMPLQVRALPCP
jgi:hypothetical protein